MLDSISTGLQIGELCSAPVFSDLLSFNHKIRFLFINNFSTYRSLFVKKTTIQS